MSRTTTAATRVPVRSPLWASAWALSGAIFSFGLGAAFTPWLLLAFPALCAALLLGLRSGLDRRAWGALAGAGWLPLWLAWLDRGGPGDACTGTVATRSCSTVGNPWPWFAAGLVMVVVGTTLALRPPAGRSDG